MKKKLLSIGLIASLVIAAFGGGVYAASKMTLIVNGEVSKVDPLLQNGTTYLPLRTGAEMLGADVEWNPDTRTATVTSKEIVTLVFPADKYPETAAHIAAAIESGHTSVCTIDRDGADKNRSQSLNGIPTKTGYDRDEWPMAMCAEGGDGASVAYVELSDNRGAGSWVGNALEDYEDGTKVAFAILGVDTKNVQVVSVAPTKVPTATPQPTNKPVATPQPTIEPVKEAETVYYANCSAVRAAGAAPIRIGDPGYSTKLDRDGDGVACES